MGFLHWYSFSLDLLSPHILCASEATHNFQTKGSTIKHKLSTYVAWDESADCWSLRQSWPAIFLFLLGTWMDYISQAPLKLGEVM
jgi:hypothetical protein